MPQTDKETAHETGCDLRRIIAEHVFLQEEGIDARLGLSFGVATYPTETATKEALIRLADERMCQEKEDRHAGR
jgi:GGDEF domain-containing protein